MRILSLWWLERALLRRILPGGFLLAGFLYGGHVLFDLAPRLLPRLFVMGLVLLSALVYLGMLAPLLARGMWELTLVRPLSRTHWLGGVVAGQGLVALGAASLPWLFPEAWSMQKMLALALSLGGLSLWSMGLQLLFRQQGLVTLFVLSWIMSHLYLVVERPSHVLLTLLPSPYELLLSGMEISHFVQAEGWALGLGAGLVVSLLVGRREWV